MLKMILKAFVKVFIAVVVVRLGILALGVNFAGGTLPGSNGKPGKATSSFSDFREMGREGLATINQLLGR